jgi:hypothetical protein
MASRSRLLFNPKRLADGSILAGSSVGQVLRRDPKGAWQRLDTGASFQIRTVVQLPDGRLLAGGEMGRRVNAGRDGSDWKAAGNPTPFGVVEWLDVLPDGRLLAAVVQSKKTLILSAASPDEGASWRELAVIEHDAYAGWAGPQTDKCLVQRVGNFITVEHQPGRMAVVDLVAGAVRTAAKLSNMSFRVQNASLTADGVAYAFVKKGSMEGLGVSRDGGATWKATTFGPGKSVEILRAHFATAQDAFRLVRNGDEGLDSQRYSRVETTSDGGATWTAGQELPYLHYFWQLGPGEFVASSTWSDASALWWTRDSGKTWTVERIPDGVNPGT